MRTLDMERRRLAGITLNMERRRLAGITLNMERRRLAGISCLAVEKCQAKLSPHISAAQL